MTGGGSPELLGERPCRVPPVPVRRMRVFSAAVVPAVVPAVATGMTVAIVTAVSATAAMTAVITLAAGTGTACVTCVTCEASVTVLLAFPRRGTPGSPSAAPPRRIVRP
ncbi:hypothetical protein SGFS_040350 [Streptomyces graminofaciens]|uniref:Uncharacterized protein n=1 Tax=Streptomyces graminofaciens TaxID=68212 RepID=A0ABN5VHI7_9ACTN|nr:hypothetical protein SGFS_040350 [Streptomyces graminofaciens]